jgi:phosphatidylglycerol:prolipoprotein diacylglycerol transferase
VYPILFSFGRRNIYTYSVVMTLFVLMALGWLLWQDRRSADGRLYAGLWALAVGLLAAKIGHITANWVYYVERPDEILALGSGGLSFHAGLIAGLGTLGIMALRRTQKQDGGWRSFAERTGILIGPLAVGLIGGWLACLMAGCAYGRAVPPPQRVYTLDLPDIYGVYAYRLPSQLLGLALALALLLISGRWARRPGLWLIALGVGDFLIGFTRGDLAIGWGPLYATQWADLALVLLGVLLELRTYVVDRSLATNSTK